MLNPSFRQFHRCNSTLSTDSSKNGVAIQELRKRLKQDNFLRRCSPSDLHLINIEDWWLNTFLLSYDNDVDVANAVVLECLKWRNNFDVEHLSMLALKPLLDRKFMFVHGYDVERNSILWINLCEHKNGDKSSDELFAYWIERHCIDTKGGGLTIVVDMKGTSLKHMDFDFFKFILHALKFYYPNTVQDLIIFDSPTIMNASWKVIRSWIDPAHPQLHLVTKESIKQYIHSVYLPQHMGGEDPFVFTMDELARCIPSRNSPDTVGELPSDEEALPDLDAFPVKRSVKFDDEEEQATRNAPLTMVQRRNSSKGPSKRSSSRSGMPSSLRLFAEKRVHAPDGDWVRNAFIAVSPRDELFLQRLEGDKDFVDIVAIRNTGENNVMFKIKTTSPEKFRVRPSTGVVPPGSTESVRVYLQNEYRHSANREKFLLMALESESTNVEQFGELWKAASSDRKVEQKLRCRVNLPEGEDSNGSVVRERKMSPDNAQVDCLRDQVAQLANSQRILLVLVIFLFLLQLIMVVYERSNSSSLRATLETIQAQLGPTVPPSPSTENSEL